VEHLKIGYYFLVLLVGTAAIVYAVLMGRAYRLPFLRPFAWFLAFNNALALVNLTSAYACANLIGFCALGRYTVLGGILGPVARLSQAGIVYALFALARGFSGRRPSGAFNRWFGAGAGILAVSYVVTAVARRGTAGWTWISRAQVLVFLAGVLAILGLLAALILTAGKTGEASKRSAIRSLGIVYLAIYAVFVLTFPLPDAVQFWPNALALLAINVFPFLWFKRPFAEAYAEAGAASSDPEALERFCQVRGLTPRECEIVGLLLRGKSNADIEKALFISIHTVKNHITSIHQKLGVRGRWQLISLFRQGPPVRSAGVGEPAVSRAAEQSQNGLRPQ
jgi:DNA-binding CsgD family transcriptional regulator